MTFEVLATELAIESQFYMDYLGDDVPSPFRDIIGNHNGYEISLCDVTYSHVFGDEPVIPPRKSTVVHSSNWNFTFTGPDSVFLNSEFQFTRGAVATSDPTSLFKVTAEPNGTFILRLYLFEDADPMGNFTETIEVSTYSLPAGTFNLDAAGYPVVAPFTYQDPGTGSPAIRTILRDFFDPGDGSTDMYYVSNDNDGGSPAWPDNFSLQYATCP